MASSSEGQKKPPTPIAQLYDKLSNKKKDLRVTLTIILELWEVWRHFCLNIITRSTQTRNVIAQSAWAVEYTNCMSAEWYKFPNKCTGYDTKQSDDKASIMLEFWGMRSTPSLHLVPKQY